jgi:Zn-dependent peptidase ImmA (M78 family)
MAIRRKRIRQLVEELLDENAIERPPIPVERIVKSRGLSIRKQRNTSSDISGFLFRQEGDVVIGVNASHPWVRQRFTIAHELGHFLLHSPRFGKIHVDRVFEVKFRDDLSSQGIDTDEREANLFAAELLMPQHFIRRDLADVGEMDLVDDDFLNNLARRYGVSTQAMLFRLANLGYVSL